MRESESKTEEELPKKTPDKKEPSLEKETSSDDASAKEKADEKSAKKEGGLYSVKESEGGFEVNLPGLIDKEKGWIVGTSREVFQTKEEAEQRAEQARENVRIQRERIPLEKAFAGTLCSISETRDGKFRVATPESHDTGMGYNWVGVANKEFGSWDEARDYLLAQQEQQEKLTEKPILEIQTGEKEKVAFSTLEAFDPKIAPSKTAHEVPSTVEKYFMSDGRLDGKDADTYQETIKEKGWEKGLYDFVAQYLKKDGSDLGKDLKIKHLDALTPKQAVELATQLVVDLTKYKTSDTLEVKGIEAAKEKTKADQSSALQILQEGLKNRDDPNWEGNGVCRNFASSVKAVFEALKVNQTDLSRLRDTYCLYEGHDEKFFDPKRQDKNRISAEAKAGHAWNTFVTVSREGSANAVVVDTTWGRRNLETKQIEKLDQTVVRMEPTVFELCKDLPENTPDKEAQISHLLSYYGLRLEAARSITPAEELSAEEKARFIKIARENYPEDKYDLSGQSNDELAMLGQTHISVVNKLMGKGQEKEKEQERQFCLTRVIQVINHHGVPKEPLPESIVSALNSELPVMAENASEKEVEILFGAAGNNPDLKFGDFLKGYLRDKTVSEYHAKDFIFKDDGLQRMVFEGIKGDKNFDKFLKESPEFRVRMRECLPDLFFDFSPSTKVEDAKELQYLAHQTGQLRSVENVFGIGSSKPSEKRINALLEQARNQLRAMSPQKYEQVVAGLDDYQIIKQYRQLTNELKNK